jgi:1-aminocyclopropane-1-carboxylate deaminase
MLTDIFSPLEHLHHDYLNQLWVKRDDLIDPYISGNKWRKLKYILQKVLAGNKTHLVTFGGAYSNHLVATAAAASKNGLQSTAFVRGEEVHNEMLVLCKLYGMQLIFTNREDYKNKLFCYHQYFGNNPDAYFIDEGGASLEGTEGCAEIISELPMDTDHIFCAAGTGTTAAGLLKGMQRTGLKAKLHVVPVLKGGSFLKEEILQYTAESDDLVMHTDYHFGGYAKTQPLLIDFIKRFTKSHGILIDPVYTAKMFFALDDLAKGGYFKPDEKIIALHTGGLLGIMGMKEKFYYI